MCVCVREGRERGRRWMARVSEASVLTHLPGCAQVDEAVVLVQVGQRVGIWERRRGRRVYDLVDVLRDRCWCGHGD